MLLLDRGYPAAWLINLLNERGILFVMRCDTASGGWRAVREFMRGDQPEAVVTLTVVVKPVVARSEDQAVFRSGRTVGLVDFSGLRWTSVM